MARCIVVLIDGLRPDAVTRMHMPVLRRLSRAYTRAHHATTVRPSATVAALTSLATGVSPQRHGLVDPGLAFLTRLGSLRPLARELRYAGIRSVAAAGPVALRSRPVAWALAACAGVEQVVCADGGPHDVVRAGLGALGARPSALGVLYLSDCDRAGHEHGWMSLPYLDAAARVDDALGLLIPLLDEALVIVLADHGGGGVLPTDHDQPHPVNDRIPLVFTGAQARREHVITRPVSILDVPPTILHWFALAVPHDYEGRPLVEAFSPVREDEAA
jgi:predicted AlkP superfamily pyrophosphatase or phosphodiesterase